MIGFPLHGAVGFYQNPAAAHGLFHLSFRLRSRQKPLQHGILLPCGKKKHGFLIGGFLAFFVGNRGLMKGLLKAFIIRIDILKSVPPRNFCNGPLAFHHVSEALVDADLIDIFCDGHSHLLFEQPAQIVGAQIHVGGQFRKGPGFFIVIVDIFNEPYHLLRFLRAAFGPRRIFIRKGF